GPARPEGVHHGVDHLAVDDGHPQPLAQQGAHSLAVDAQLPRDGDDHHGGTPSVHIIGQKPYGTEENRQVGAFYVGTAESPRMPSPNTIRTRIESMPRRNRQRRGRTTTPMT